MKPFLYGTIVGADNFYDRKKECNRIAATLSGGNNIVLYAPRRFGKTSMIYKVIEQMEEAGFICIYFDMMPVFSPESFVRLYTKALSKKQSSLDKFAKTFIEIVKNIRPVISFGQDGKPELSVDLANTVVDETVISQLLDLPELVAGKDKRVIVFFDEFQEVKKMENIKFEALLRSKVQQHKRTNYLFFGSKTHLLKEMFNNKKRAFYNSASQMTIGNLPERETIEFLQKKFSLSNISIDAKTAKYLIEVAADIPHYIQFLASEVWQNTVNIYSVVTEGIIDDSVRNVLAHNNDYYMEVFENRSPSQKQLLKALSCDGKNIFSADYIKKYRLPAISTIQRSVKNLIDKGIVEKKGNEYFIADPFFKMFMTYN